MEKRRTEKKERELVNLSQQRSNKNVHENFIQPTDADINQGGEPMLLTLKFLLSIF